LIIDFVIGDRVYTREVYNKDGFSLEFIDREHAEHFLKEHPEAVGSHDYEIRPKTYTAQQIDDNQQSYGNGCNEWDGFIYK
jgi:hypothetical protein